MDPKLLKQLLEDVSSGRVSPADAIGRLKDLPFADFGIAKHDAHRVLRNGFSEVVLCEGKKIEHLIRIVGEISARGHNVFGTRASEEAGRLLVEHFPKIDFDSVSRTFRLDNCPNEPIAGKIAILCAGTADIPVAEEARCTAAFFGVESSRHYDVGVAGLHRLIGCMDLLGDADVVIAAAGMEGALPSVVGGLVPSPVIAVPTSAGYGVNLGGINALMSMLGSCSEGISVVNIDNGFGAACAALRILRKIVR